MRGTVVPSSRIVTLEGYFRCHERLARAAGGGRPYLPTDGVIHTRPEAPRDGNNDLTRLQTYFFPGARKRNAYPNFFTKAGRSLL